MRVEHSTHIAAPPERVYDIVMNPERLRDWVTIHHSLEGNPSSPLRKGSTLTQVLKLAGSKFHVHWKVVENEPCEHVVWEGRGPVASHARVEYRFDSNDGGTDFSYVNEYDLPGGPLGRFAGKAVARVTQKEVEGSLQRLKRLVE
jgi:carbon monoxide dehydrogenase subunit G